MMFAYLYEITSVLDYKKIIKYMATCIFELSLFELVKLIV